MTMTAQMKAKINQFFSVCFDYPVYFTHDLFNVSNHLLKDVLSRLQEARRHRAMVYVDSGVAHAWPQIIPGIRSYFERYADDIALAASPVIIPGGEVVKDDQDQVWRMMGDISRLRLDRQSYVIAIGGGALLDAVGFAAALVHRGLRLVRVPTTTLGQNDAGIGVKNGINAWGQKNALGSFAPPFAVLNDYDFLTTLSFEHWIGGAAEAFKVAIIKDADFFNYLKEHRTDLNHRSQSAMEETVYRCAMLHLDHIRGSGDPFEFGSARPLDFGHWAAHKLEIMSGYQIGHGHAVSIGMSIDSHTAMSQGLLTQEELKQIIGSLRICGLPAWSPLLERRRTDGTLEILEGIEQFREHLGGRLTITLPRGIGNCVEVHHMDAESVENAIRFLKKYSADIQI
jgi:3-dehydroquinate synthase